MLEFLYREIQPLIYMFNTFLKHEMLSLSDNET